MEDLLNYLLAPVGQVALIIGLAQLVKNLGLKSKYIPLFDVLCGLVGGILVYFIEFKYDIIQSIMIGLAIGLSACGLFSGIKNITEKKEW
jgi:uncharacterized membrane protein HdeD (DUF308 family)